MGGEQAVHVIRSPNNKESGNFLMCGNINRERKKGLSRCRQKWFVVLINLLMLLGLSSKAAFAQQVYIFVPTLAAPQFIEGILRQACPTFTIQVAEDWQGFLKLFQSKPPEVLIATKPTIVYQFPEYNRALQGILNGSGRQAYSFVSFKPFNTSELASASVGAVMVISRPQMADYQFTAKLEFLSNMLKFDRVDAIFLPKHMKSSLLQDVPYSQRIYVSPIELYINLPQVALKPGVRVAQIQACLGDSNIGDVNSMLGVDAWAPIE